MPKEPFELLHTWQGQRYNQVSNCCTNGRELVAPWPIQASVSMSTSFESGSSRLAFECLLGEACQLHFYLSDHFSDQWQYDRVFLRFPGIVTPFGWYSGSLASKTDSCHFLRSCLAALADVELFVSSDESLPQDHSAHSKFCAPTIDRPNV